MQKLSHTAPYIAYAVATAGMAVLLLLGSSPGAIVARSYRAYNGRAVPGYTEYTYRDVNLSFSVPLSPVTAVEARAKKDGYILFAYPRCPYEVESITLDSNEGKLTVGNSHIIKATVAPEEVAAETTIEWSSSNEKVATVDSNGKVTAVSSGNATITATAGEESANYEVTVEQPKKATTSNKTYSSSSSNSAAVTPSNPAPVTPVTPSAPTTPVQPSNPEPAAPAPAQPDPAPAQPSQPSGGDSGSTENKPNGSGGWEWGGPVISTPTDNGCPPEEHAGGLC